MSSDRAVIYVESGTALGNLRSTTSPEKHLINPSGGNQGGSNYVIKIQIGEEAMFNPVRIDVSAGPVSSRVVSKPSPSNSNSSNSSCGDESPLDNSSGQSSPRSDMTPPPRINTGAANRFGSETSESDTESDVSAEFRPLSCQAAKFALREICQVETSPPPLPRSIMKKTGGGVVVLGPSTLEGTNELVTPIINTGSNGTGDEIEVVTTLPPPPILNEALIRKLGQKTEEKSVKSPEDFYDGAQALPPEIPTREEKVMGMVKPLMATAGPQTLLKKPLLSLTERMERCKILVDQSGFHVNEINEVTGRGSKAANESEESLSNFAGYRDIFARTNKDGTKQILSDRGTIRGVKNRVRDGIATFLQTKDNKTYAEKEQGRVVVYVTSMGVVRDTFQRCQKVKQILRNLLVKFDERDCYMNRAIQNEIRQRLPQQNHHLALPQVFLEGQLLGDAEVIEKLNETGELRDLLKPYKSLSVLSTCERCGGFRMLPCPICNGSKKSVHRNHFTTEFIALKCMHCDPSGLVRCDLCNAPDS